MSNAAATTTEEVVEQTPVTFVHKCGNQIIMMSQTRRVAAEGVVNVFPGHSIKFVNGLYTTSNPEEIAFLRGHRHVAMGLMVEIEDGDLPQLQRPAPKRVRQRPKSPPRVKKGARHQSAVEGPVRIECPAEGCSFVAEATTIAQATRKMNGHMTATGHRPPE